MKSAILRAIHPLRAPIAWGCQRGLVPFAVKCALPYRWATEPFDIRIAGTSVRWFPSDLDTVGRRIFWSGLRDWERETAPVILSEIARARCFLDIGANTGIYTVLGCAINPSVRVVAFEPVPKVYAALTCNVQGNGLQDRVTALNIALGETNGTVDFHEAENATMGSLATNGYHGQRGLVITVECRTLDSVVEEAGLQPDFMKIDVEGFEHAVLAGGRRTLQRWRPRMVLEANPGDPADAVSAILSDYGYVFDNLTAAGRVRHDELSAIAGSPNWLCTPREDN